MKKLDWNRLLGFDQLGNDRDRRVFTETRIGGKIGGKGCEPIRAVPQNR
jgi:hypothetical protein